MSKKHAFLQFFSKITLFACVFCAFFIPSAFATLPTGYTELEYIESTGTQYIDTGIKPNSTSEFEIECTQTFLSGVDYQSMWGAVRTASGTDDYQQYYDNSATKGAVYIRLGKSISTGTSNASPNLQNVWKMDGTKNIVSFHSNTGILKVNNQEYSGKSCSGTSVGNLTIFGGHIKTSGSGMYQMGAGKIYVFKWWLNSELVRNFIPARRNSDNVLGMYDTVSGTFFTNVGTGTFIAGPRALPEHCVSGSVGTCTECESGYVLNNGACTKPIKIATTAYNSARFSPVVTDLNSTIATIRDVVTNTITQTGQIATLQSEKQTRPNETCPAGKKCLLVTDENGTPHWYEIIEPFNAVEFLNLLINTNGSKLYRRGNITSYSELGGNGVILISQPPADSGLRQLNETEWAVQWDNMGAVYGTTVCNGNSGTGGVASSTEQTETKGLKCWCKMTSVVDLGGVEHDVSSSSWVFQSKYTSSSATDCAASCAKRCALNVRDDASFRSAMFGTVKF